METEFKIEDYTVIPEPEDEYKDYVKVKIDSIVGKPFIVEKAEIVDDKNGHMLRMGVDINGDKILIYTSSKILVATIENVIKKHGSVPLIQMKIVGSKLGSFDSYEFKSA